MTFANGTAVEN